MGFLLMWSKKKLYLSFLFSYPRGTVLRIKVWNANESKTLFEEKPKHLIPSVEKRTDSWANTSPLAPKKQDKKLYLTFYCWWLMTYVKKVKRSLPEKSKYVSLLGFKSSMIPFFLLLLSPSFCPLFSLQKNFIRRYISHLKRIYSVFVYGS